MTTYQVKRKADRRDGDIYFVQGYEFIVTNLRIAVIQGRNSMRFNGYCTDNPVNDSIHNTAYNGGEYSMGWISDEDAERWKEDTDNEKQSEHERAMASSDE